MAFPKPPAKIVPFNSGPVASHDIGRQFDEHQKAIREVIDFLKTLIRDDGVVKQEAMPAPVQGGSKEPTSPVGILGPGAGGKFAADDKGATAVSADYAQVCIDWAEHMPDVIPLQTLAVNAITGDHWSARWWASRAGLILQTILASGFVMSATAPFAERVNVLGHNSLAGLSHSPLDALTTMQMLVNGKVFSGCAIPAPFTVAGTTITWASTIYSVNPGDEVIARYICAT